MTVKSQVLLAVPENKVKIFGTGGGDTVSSTCSCPDRPDYNATDCLLSLEPNLCSFWTRSGLFHSRRTLFALGKREALSPSTVYVKPLAVTASALM